MPPRILKMLPFKQRRGCDGCGAQIEPEITLRIHPTKETFHFGSKECFARWIRHIAPQLEDEPPAGVA